ncbi:UspA domain protein [Tolumonas auensis DSM 9187]|uniref:UspA domain protein n=1 Tax=Tolumonas auensis (strain DSM 9187 / NBRC 110442 / TA 4) TaxID=595494 RepID=C4LEU0_TOLAT|nr:universal stress protein [Tolumonas auensis]ACQ93107.1 UspA domain protein [Tolumonas auensis DSM 9187]
MKEQIIACVDGSRSTTAVCQWSAWVAPRLDAPVKLLHTLEKPANTDAGDLSGSIGLGSREELMVELIKLDEQRSRITQEQGKLLLAAAKDLFDSELPNDHAITIKTCLRHGNLVETLSDLEADTRLVIMGRQGEISSQVSQVGSQLENVVRVLHTPILVSVGEFNAPQKIMFAYDGSETGKKVLERLTISPLFKGLSCDLVMVGGEYEQLISAQSLLHNAGIMTTTYQLKSDVEAALKEHIQHHQIDLVIMGAYGHSRLRQFLLGSHTSRMLSQSPVSLLLLR